MMEHKHKQRIRDQYPQEARDTRFHVLHIEDRFHAMDPRLIEELKAAIDPFIEQNQST